MEAQLLECINFSLNNYLFQNAVFLAERLQAEAPSEDHLHVLATCHYRSGRAYRVVSLLQGCVSAQNRYLFALSCYELGKLHDAQAALTGPSLLRHYTHSSPSSEDVPNGPAGLYLLGQIYRRLHQKEKAIECFKKSLHLYPFFWSAFEALCNMGEDVDPGEYFGGEKAKQVVLQQWKQQQLAQQAQHLHTIHLLQQQQQQQLPSQQQQQHLSQQSQQMSQQPQTQQAQQQQQTIQTQKTQSFLKPPQPLQPHPGLDASTNFADYSRDQPFQTPVSTTPFSPLSHSPIPLLATPSPGWGLSKAFSFSQTPSSPALLSTPFSPPSNGYPSFVLDHPPTSPPSLPLHPAASTPAPPFDSLSITNAPTPPQVSTPVSKPPPVIRRKPEAAGRQRGGSARPTSASASVTASAQSAPRRSARLLFGDDPAHATPTPSASASAFASTPASNPPVAATPAQNAAPAHVFATPAPAQAAGAGAGLRPQRPRPKAVKDNKRRTTEPTSATSFNTKLNAITNSTSHPNLSTKSSNTTTNNNTTNGNVTDNNSTSNIPNHSTMNTNTSNDPFLHNYNEDTHGGENHPPPPSHTSFSVSDTLNGALKLWQLLVAFGVAYRHLTACRCREALDAIDNLIPPEHENTAWVKTLAGRAHFELVDYKSAADDFENARRLDASRLDDMEIYSTVLWHLRRPEDLACLGQKLLELDRLDARTWCAVGNTFSLLKDHDQAIKVFKRSIQLDPMFSYAYTLAGHEYVANDDLDKAMASFRSAILVDPRHYNAWYGLGLIYFRQEKYDMAEKHFLMALKINPKSSVLYCYVGMVLLSNKKLHESLEMLNKAIEIDSKNTLARYKRAHVLASLDQHQAALQELELLQNQAPREASIYILQAKILKRLQEPFKALNALATAADLDPKNAVSLKDAMDKLSSSSPSSTSLDDENENDSSI